MIIDLFAGAGGWDVAARRFGMDPVGVEHDRWACATRAAAGLLTIRQDVRTFSAAHLRGRVDGLIASPPCPEFSRANNRRGGLDTEQGRLTLEPLRVVGECMPRWVAMEQVPDVLPIWRHVYGPALRDLGYDVDSRVLCAADYGTPQVRNRAILMARLDGRVVWPVPTHAETPGMLGELPWVSMADALGWGITDRPSPVIPATSSAGGPKGIDGGSGARKMLADAEKGGSWQRGAWLDTRRDQRPDGSTQTRSIDQPAPAVTAVPAQWVLRAGRLGNATVRTIDQPAPTVQGGNDLGSGGWTLHRPATTVAGDCRIWPPGHKINADDIAKGRTGHDRAGTHATRVTIAELAALQDFPADHPWQGTKTAQARQIGNAIPARLAHAVLGAVSGITPNTNQPAESEAAA